MHVEMVVFRYVNPYVEESTSSSVIYQDIYYVRHKPLRLPPCLNPADLDS